MPRRARRCRLAVVLALGAPGARAQAAREVKVGLLVPLSGLYARPGEVMRMGAELAIEDINAAGGIKALGGAKLELVVLDSGDTTEKAKNAAQRMVAAGARPGRRDRLLPLLVHARGHRGHRARQAADADPVLFRHDHRARLQIHLPDLGDRGLAGRAVAADADRARREPPATKPKTVAIVTDNTAASVASVKPMRERLLKELGLELVVDETFTPPLADATPLIQQVRTTRPDLLLLRCRPRSPTPSWCSRR